MKEAGSLPSAIKSVVAALHRAKFECSIIDRYTCTIFVLNHCCNRYSSDLIQQESLANANVKRATAVHV